MEIKPLADCGLDQNSLLALNGQKIGSCAYGFIEANGAYKPVEFTGCHASLPSVYTSGRKGCVNLVYGNHNHELPIEFIEWMTDPNRHPIPEAAALTSAYAGNGKFYLFTREVEKIPKLALMSYAKMSRIFTEAYTHGVAYSQMIKGGVDPTFAYFVSQFSRGGGAKISVSGGQGLAWHGSIIESNQASFERFYLKNPHLAGSSFSYAGVDSIWDGGKWRIIDIFNALQPGTELSEEDSYMGYFNRYYKEIYSKLKIPNRDQALTCDVPVEKIKELGDRIIGELNVKQA